MPASGQRGRLSPSPSSRAAAPSPRTPPGSTPPALPVSPESPLVKIARASQPSPELTGVRLLPYGAFSLDARIQLARRATRSLDVQYYVFENDATGRLLLREMQLAADRGVRVRLLLDDLFTGRTDELLRGLASFPNAEVHLFNPFCCARKAGLAGRYAASLFDFGRLNHRMHNKLFIADGVMAVMGGRNIADEYFQLNEAQNFIDMDAFVVGDVVRQFEAIFDRYWNSEVVYAIDQIGEPLGDRAARRAKFIDTLAALPMKSDLQPQSTDVLGYGPIGEDLDSGQLGMEWARARAFADPPEKLRSASTQVAFETSVTNAVMMNVWQAKQELVLTSPYLIPGEKGVANFRALQNNKVKVTVMTNSLAATDEPLVHNSYARYRPGLLDAGVDLYELSPTRVQRTSRLGMFDRSIGRLHAKTAVIDRQQVFIGSMNLDPRSANANTELGMFVDSPRLARELIRVVNISKLDGAYRVRRDEKTQALQWLTSDGDKEIILLAEPESTFWGRVKNSFFGFFVPEQLL
jgi:putative cardiolipin synthase